MSKISSLTSLYPEIAKEWHPTKNDELTPYDVKSKSNKKVWWLCPKGHEYESRILSRAYGSGCSYCDGKKTAPERSLAKVNPELAKEWHPTKNGKLEPIDFMPGSTKRVWWQCSDSHEWQALIGNRHLHKARCPYCAKKRAHPLYCLGNNNPEIAKEWHPTKNAPLTPYDVTSGSDKKVWWICSKDKDHEYEARVYSRSQGRGCPYCTGRKVDKINCLATKNPEMAKNEWHPSKNMPLTPFDVTEVSGKKVWWQCSCGNEWEARIASRKGSNGFRGCPTCSRSTSVPECRVVAELRLFFEVIHGKMVPVQLDGEETKLKQADILIPNLKLIIEVDGSYHHRDTINNDKFKTKRFQELGYTVMRLRGEKLIPVSDNDIKFDCGKIKVLDVLNLLKQILVNFCDKLDIGAKKKIEEYVKANHQEFQNDHEFERIRTAPVGSHNGRNLSIARPDLAAEWSSKNLNNMKPENFLTKSNQSVWWICSKGHEWECKISDRAKGGCPFCSGKRASPEHCLATNNPELSKEWHSTKNGDLTPFSVTPKSYIKVWWICSKGHEWQATPDARNGAKTGCPYCANRKVGVDNNLQKLNPEIAKEWHPTKNSDLSPLNVMPNSKKKVWWLCKKDNTHEYQMIVGSKTNGYKCPICSGRKVDKTTCLAMKNPELTKEWHKIKNEKTPHDFTTGSKFKAWWICPKCKHEYQSLILTRSHGHGCPACSNQAKKERAISRWTKYREDKLRGVSE